MNDGKIVEYRGRYLRPQRPGRRRRCPCRQCFAVVVLLLGNGALLYMIVRCLIDPVCGAVFMSVLSVYLGCKLKEE